MIRLTYSNRTEALLDTLVRRLEARRSSGDPLAPVQLVVPNRNVQRFVELGLARRLGIAANLRFARLEQLVRRWLEPGGPLLLEDALGARLLRALLDEALLDRPAMAPVRRYLRGAGDAGDAIDLRRVQLAMHLTRLFGEYGFSRPELFAAWDAGRARHAGTPQAGNEAWQAELWRAARAHPSSAGHRTLAEALESAEAPPLASELHVFGLSYVARIFSRVYAALGARAELYLYTLNPCEEFWEDLETASELRKRRRTSDAEPDWLFADDDPFRLSVDTETPLLRLWGRPGREHVRMLGALTECDFEPAFVDPLAVHEAASRDALPLFASLGAPPLLARLQRDVLARTPRPERADPSAPRDASVQILACPSVRREVETVASEIWHLIESIDGLTFDQIAVLVNGPDRDLYLPHLSAAFEEAHRIPYNVADLSLSSASPLVEGAVRLLALPRSRFTRPELLGVITHPAVRPPDVDAHAWVALSDRLGIFHGLDHQAHAGTYVEEDLLNWEQGLVRIALGAFVAGEASGDPRFVELDGARYLPEEPPVGETSAARFAHLCRSLSSDVRFARSARLSLREWSGFFTAMVGAYLSPPDEREASALRNVLEALGALADWDLDGASVSYTVAHELAREALEALSTGRGQQLADGVAISSLVPMRAIPFRVIFVLGLGEGRFPAADRRDTMDLRAARRQVGDVTPPERDRYTFLETMLCARDRLYVSYVARDEQTGDELEPSTVVQELIDVVDASYLPDAKNRIVRCPPLRRHREPAMVAVLPEAAAELRAVELGHALAEQLAGSTDALAQLARPEALRRVGRSEAVRDALGLAALPERAPGADPNATLRVTLAALRRFLECPLQAWTRTVLRLEEDELDTSFALADEPFEPSALDATVALRASFAAHAVHGVDLRDAYAAEVEPRKARGRWPIGAVEALVAREHLEILERWRAALGSLGAARWSTARFGSASTHEESVEVLDPIVVVFDDDPRAPGSGRPLRVELVGRTDLSSDAPRSSVLPLLREGRGSRGRVSALRYALRAFFDHAALSASDRVVDAHRSVLLYGDREDARPAILTFDGLSAGAARAWLSDLVRDLVSRRHAYLMPCEAVLRLADRWDRIDGEDLVRSVEEVRDRWGGGQSRFGPVREPLRYPALAPGDAEEIADRRFGPFLRSFRPG